MSLFFRAHLPLVKRSLEYPEAAGNILLQRGFRQQLVNFRGHETILLGFLFLLLRFPCLRSGLFTVLIARLLFLVVALSIVQKSGLDVGFIPGLPPSVLQVLQLGSQATGILALHHTSCGLTRIAISLGTLVSSVFGYRTHTQTHTHKYCSRVS